MRLPEMDSHFGKLLPLHGLITKLRFQICSRDHDQRSRLEKRASSTSQIGTALKFSKRFIIFSHCSRRTIYFSVHRSEQAYASPRQDFQFGGKPRQWNSLAAVPSGS